MGYSSSVHGAVRMSRKCFAEMLNIRLRLSWSAKPLTMGEFFELIFYHDGACTVDSFARHYDLEQMIDLLAHFKEGETPDEILYQGDNGIEDSGTYFILPGRWAYASVRHPVIQDVKEGDWVKKLRRKRRSLKEQPS
jgi:hypothetical protein